MPAGGPRQSSGPAPVSAAPRAGTGSFVSPRHEPRARAADYAVLSAGWAALLAAAVAAARDRGDEPVAAVEVVPLGLATFALSKLVAKEKVDRWMREPFLEEHADGRREPRGEGLRYAIGELLACTRCVGMWSAAGLVALRVSRPREARVVSAVRREPRADREDLGGADRAPLRALARLADPGVLGRPGLVEPAHGRRVGRVAGDLGVLGGLAHDRGD